MKDDTISRQAAIDALDRLEYTPGEWATNGLTMCKDAIKALPTAQRWIPCTPETMPKMTDTYLVQVGVNENGEGMHTEVRTADWNVVWHEWYVHTTRCFVGDIIKWMPIPREGGPDGTAEKTEATV